MLVNSFSEGRIYNLLIPISTSKIAITKRVSTKIDDEWVEKNIIHDYIKIATVTKFNKMLPFVQTYMCITTTLNKPENYRKIYKKY